MNTKPVVVGGSLVGLIVLALVAKQFLMAKANPSVEPRLDPQSLTERPVDAPITSAGASTGPGSSTEAASNKAPESVRHLPEELIERCKRSETAVTDLFASAYIGDFAVDRYISMNRRFIAGSELTDLGEVDGTHQFVIGPPGVLTTPRAEYFKCVVGQRDGKWLITGFTDMKNR